MTKSDKRAARAKQPLKGTPTRQRRNWPPSRLPSLAYPSGCIQIVAFAMSTPSANKTFLSLFAAGDVDSARTLLLDNPTLSQHAGNDAHPLLREAVMRNHGHCYQRPHLQIADLLISDRVQAFRDAVLNDRTGDVVDRLKVDPEIVHAEFTAGRGIAQAFHHWNSIPTATVLLDAGADLDVETTLGETPLAMQLRFGTVEAVRFLLEQGATPVGNHMPSNTLIERISLLLEYGWQIDSSYMLHDANHGHGKRVMTWLESGADPMATTDNGQTALHLFASRGTGREAIRALVQAGTDINATDADGNTPLSLARSATRQTAAQELISLGAK